MTSQIETHALQCPSCGAPVLPNGAEAVVSCPYCHTTVIVPETLRQTSRGEHSGTAVFENFATNDNGWLIGTETSEFFSSLRREISDGRYRWEAQRGAAASTTTALLPGYLVGDFHLQVSAKHIVGSKTSSSWGAIFRAQDHLNYFVFRLTDNQLFTVAVVEEGEWQMLVDWTVSRAIRPYGVNQLTVLGRGAHLVLSINGEVVAELDDDRFGRGYVGLALEGYVVGEKTVIDFLDLSLNAP